MVCDLISPLVAVPPSTFLSKFGFLLCAYRSIGIYPAVTNIACLRTVQYAQAIRSIPCRCTDTIHLGDDGDDDDQEFEN